jgi:hypothetical protein
MNGMVNSRDAPGDDPCMVTGIRHRRARRRNCPGEHPWFGQFRQRVRLAWNQGQMGSDSDGQIRLDVPRGQLEDFIRAVRQAARDADAEYQASLARWREYALREAQADPAKRARLAEDQARIDAVLAETEQ